MSSRGWIRLDRKLLDDKMWLDEPFTKGQAWVDLLMMASHKADKVFKGNIVYENRPGLVITSISKLADRWQWSRHKVSDYLTLLERLDRVSTKRTGKRTEVFIVNWGVYQDAGTGKRTVQGQFKDSLRTVQGHNQECNNNIDNVVDGGRGSSAPAAGPTANDIDEIISLWNSVEHTAKVSRIIEGTERYKNLCKCYSVAGAGGITDAIGKVRNSSYLKRKGHVSFDSYMNPDAVIKLLEGAYDEDYGGSSNGSYTDWEAIGRNLDQLSNSQDG